MPIKVAIVEDDEEIRGTLTHRISSSRGFQLVDSFSDAESAVSGLPPRNVDVVLMDIAMPVTNGFDVAKSLRECCPDARIVALTGFAPADIVRRTRQAGFADCVIKPAQPEVLKQVVDDQCSDAGRS